MKIICNLSFKSLLFGTLLAMFSFKTIYCQDIIYTNDGRKLLVRVLEIEEQIVKYKNFNQPEGPIRNINKQYIDFILYENGNKESFSLTQTGRTTLQAAEPAINNNTENISYVNMQIERYKSMENAGTIIMYGGIIVFTLSGIISLTDDNPSDFMISLVGIGLLSGAASALFADYAANRVRYFEKRKNELSFFVSPKRKVSITDGIATNYFSVGVRISFN